MDFKEKAEFFNDFFSKQWSLFNNNSKLLSVLNKKTCKSLSYVEFLTYDILKLIRNLNPKAHGHGHGMIQGSRSRYDKYSNVKNL